MRYRQFGKTGLNISEIGFGTWSMGGMWGACDDKLATAALNEGLDQGINFFDTAYVYGDGHSETLIGNVVRKRKVRDQVVIATKVPPKDYHWPAKVGSDVTKIFPASWIREMTETSLKNLQMDYVDIQQLHVWAPNWLNQGDWLEEFRKLKKEGKIRFFGVSINDHQPDTALELVASGLIDSVQVIYNIFDQSPAEKLLPACVSPLTPAFGGPSPARGEGQNVGVIIRVPFDEGGLTGTLTPHTQFSKKDWRRFYFKGDRLQETCDHVEKLKNFLDSQTPTLPELALKFCLGHPAVSTVIPGMRKIDHVKSCAHVSHTLPLSLETLASLKSHAWPRNFYPVWEEETSLEISPS